MRDTPLGLVLGVLLFLFSAVGTYAHGITRQVCTGIAIGTLVVLGGFAIAVLFFADT